MMVLACAGVCPEGDVCAQIAAGGAAEDKDVCLDGRRIIEIKNNVNTILKI
jgi:hypothetical protein